MGFWDALMGRRKPVGPDLDRLFALPSAAVTLQAGAGFAPTGLGSVCFAGVEGGAFDRIETDVRALLPGAEFSGDSYGYTWALSRHTPRELPALVNDLHAVNTLLQDAGFGPQLLCSLVGFRDQGGDGRPLALVYLYKRGTFYPFAPLPGIAAERRDNALELQTRGLLADDLPVEEDLSRWFPLWGAPGL
ncbi:PspA-associated protein PspAB [Streptomyces chumphonensis]|uniref:PspA-associated protein PspAB n=1 Tax=Streptomyces chumphonensis TaxID=1214925 RepID=UPI003D7319D6